MPWCLAGPAPAPQAKTAPHGPGTGSRKVSHPVPTGTRAGPRPSPRGQNISSQLPKRTQRLPTGRARLGLQLHGIFYGNHRRSISNPHEIRPCNNLELILCRLKPAINTNITKPHKRTPKFRNPSLPSFASPIPHPCALLPHLHATLLR
jgi:hypothetical protein